MNKKTHSSFYSDKYVVFVKTGKLGTPLKNILKLSENPDIALTFDLRAKPCG